MIYTLATRGHERKSARELRLRVDGAVYEVAQDPRDSGFTQRHRGHGERLSVPLCEAVFQLTQTAPPV